MLSAQFQMSSASCHHTSRAQIQGHTKVCSCHSPELRSILYYPPSVLEFCTGAGHYSGIPTQPHSRHSWRSHHQVSEHQNSEYYHEYQSPDRPQTQRKAAGHAHAGYVEEEGGWKPDPVSTAARGQRPRHRAPTRYACTCTIYLLNTSCRHQHIDLDGANKSAFTRKVFSRMPK